MMRKNNNDLKQNRKKGASTAHISKLPPVNSRKKTSIPQIFTLDSSTHQDQGLVGLLHEYFIKHNFLQTLDSFQRDCLNKGFKQTAKVHSQFKQELISTFDNGQRETFMTKFAQYVPMSMRAKDPQTMRIEFYLQVYFFVYGIHPQLGKKKLIDPNSKQILISYLEGKGSILAKQTQFLQYYALAYLQKPQQHPTFKVIFTKDWIAQLRQRVVYFIEKLYPNNRKPVLVTVYDRFIEKNLQQQRRSSSMGFQHQIQHQAHIQEQIELQPPSELTQAPQILQIQLLQKKILQLQQDKAQLVNLIQSSNKKYQSLQNTYKDFVQIARQNLMESQVKWFQITQEFFAIANDLLDNIRKLQDGIPLQDPNIIEKTAKKLSNYQSFINMNIEDLLSDNVDFSLFQATEHDISTDLVRRNTEYRGNHMIQLNFNKINALLISQLPQQQQEKCLILQALRWRLSKTRGIILKREVVMSYIIYDILGLKTPNSQTFHNLLRNQNPTISILTAKLLNSFVKDYYARQYLVCQTFMLQCISAVKDPSLDQRIRTFLIITLQQVSLRAKAQNIMIEGDMIRWLVHKMNAERETMQVHLMEYLSTLLLNLLLRKEGLQKSQQIKEEILMTLTNLMEYQLLEVRSYAHGSLYPLLSKKVFRDKAKEYGMQQNIKYLIGNNPPPEFLNQLRYLQQRLQMEQDSKEDDDQQDQEGDNDIDQIVDEEIEDIDQMEQEEGLIVGGDRMGGILLHGQQLLMKNYALNGPEGIQQLNAVRAEVNNSLKRKSMFDANSFYDRSSANTPIMGKMRRNISNNNSVYSNRSSNRVLKSEMKNRQIQNKKQPQGKSQTRQANQRLDTVHQNNSQISMKELNDDRRSIGQFSQKSRNRQGGQLRQSQIQGQNKNNLTHSQKQTKDLFIGSQHHAEESPMEGTTEHQQIIQQSPKGTRNQHVYEKNKDYKEAFQTRSRLVRTPPEK